MQKVYTKIESIVGNVVTVRASGVRSGDLALVGESYASVIKLRASARPTPCASSGGP